MDSIGGDSAFVLYVDHQGHPAPLSLSYHATASRRLASSINRHPPSTMTEVDSALCPQCLSFHDATTAAKLGYCPTTCKLCPLCRSVATVAVEEELDCFYKCGLCDWTSKACFLQTQVAATEDGNISLEEVERASTELDTQWKTLVEQRNQASEEHYKTTLSALTGLAKEQVKGLRSSNQYFPTVTTKRKLDGPEGWSIQALEESIEERGKLFMDASNEIIGGQEVPLVSLMAEHKLDVSLRAKNVESLLMQQHCGGPMIESMNDLLPLPVPLRPRKSRRCRAEMAEGRPGILLKPKLNPLEGDSSLRTGHGQWWKKDSSAMEVLPRVQVSIHASDGSRHAFLFKVSNPTLGLVRLRLSGSTYQGESDWNDKASTLSLLQNVLVDPLTQTSVNAVLDTSLADSFPVTETCELEPAEDSFLELGKSNNDNLPEAVVNWDAGDVLFDSKVSQDSPCSMRLVGKKNSFAWFELVLMEPKQAEDNMHCAIPLAMQIEVGAGSWDSSLIPTKHLMEDGPKDFVSFDLLVLWENFD